MKSKKEITLTLKDLIELGIIKKKKKKKKRKDKRIKHNKTGYEMNGLKSDSSHMASYSQNMPFSGTSNQTTELTSLQIKALEDQIKHPDRFIKNEPTNYLTIDQFKNSLSPMLNRFMNLESATNQLFSDLNYDKSEFINVKGQKTEDETDKYFDVEDSYDVSTEQGTLYFNNEGNSDLYQESEPYNNPIKEQPITPPALDNELLNEEESPIKEQPSETKIKTPKKKYFTIEPTDKLVNNYQKASEKFKKLLLQFGKTDDEINDTLQNNNISSLRKIYKEYYLKASIKNKKLQEKYK